MPDFWRAVLYLHLLSMAFFLGGQLVFGLAVVPVLRDDAERERMRAVARRFGKAHALQGLILLVTLAIVWLGLTLATGGA